MTEWSNRVPTVTPQSCCTHEIIETKRMPKKINHIRIVTCASITPFFAKYVIPKPQLTVDCYKRMCLLGSQHDPPKCRHRCQDRVINKKRREGRRQVKRRGYQGNKKRHLRCKPILFSILGISTSLIRDATIEDSPVRPKRPRKSSRGGLACESLTLCLVGRDIYCRPS